MKKLFILISMFFTTLVIAGGDVSPVMFPVETVYSNSCKKDGVYKDHCLMWQDQSYGDIEDGAYRRNLSKRKAGHYEYAKRYCKRLKYSGYIDWRLPTSDELMSLHNKYGNPFVNFREGDFWSSTPSGRNRYYVVYTADAFRYKRDSEESNYIRCVRYYKNCIYI